MKTKLWILWMLVGASFLTAPPNQAAAADQPKTSRPNIYDESAEGSKEVADALAAAKKQNKRVLLQFGANWCGWCHKLHQLFEEDRSIHESSRPTISWPWWT
jgi:thiol:disulfide interchange protein